MVTSTENAKPNTLGDFFANAWDILVAETLDEDETVGPRKSLLFSQSRKPKETYDYIYYEERDGAREVPHPKYSKKSTKKASLKDQGVSQKDYAPDLSSKIDESELPTTIAVVSQSPAMKNRFMAQEYKEIRNNMKTLMEIDEEDLNSVGIDIIAAKAKEQASEARPKSKREERIKPHVPVKEKAIEKKKKSRVSGKKNQKKQAVSLNRMADPDPSSHGSRSPREPSSSTQLHRKLTSTRFSLEKSAPTERRYDYSEEDRKKRVVARNRIVYFDRSSRSSRPPHEPHSSIQMHRKLTSTRASQERAVPTAYERGYDYDEESRDAAVDYYAQPEYCEPVHPRHTLPRTSRYRNPHIMYDDAELCSYCDSNKRSSTDSLKSAKRFLGLKR
jgi:hypothetical protein